MEPETEKNVAFFRFEDLRIYHKALDYIVWIYDQCSKFPDDGSLTLASGFIQSAQGIALNIAEGSARNKSQFIYYLKMAKSSVRECVVFTSLAAQKHLLDSSAEDESRTQLMEMTKMLGALIGSLQRSSQHHDDDDED